MIKNNSNHGASLKEIRKKEQQDKDLVIIAICETIAIERYGEDKLKAWRKEFGSVWFLPVLNEEEEGKVDKLAVLRPINRHILSHASTKIEDEGLYVFLEACMRECWIEGDNELLEDDEYFIPAAMKFNKVIEGKKVVFLKK